MSTTATNQNLSNLPEINDLMALIENTNAPDELKAKLKRMTQRLILAAKIGGYSTEFESIKKYADWVSMIPWNRYSIDNLDLKSIEKSLNQEHYGLNEVKNTLLEYISVVKLKAQNLRVQTSTPTTQGQAQEVKSIASNAPVMCFVGIQGVGKTSMARSIATALGRPFVRVSLGALGNAVEIRGKSKSEKDAEPGQIIKALAKAKVMNPLILLDEIDKVSGQDGLRADVMAALLEILDPEQNSTFIDHYIDHPVDLSKVIFITTANNLGGISTALLDRLEIVRFSSYSIDEKKVIAKNYLFPKVRKSTGLSPEQLQFADDVWDVLISPLGFDAGIRQLERNITKISRKAAKMIVDGLVPSVVISKDNFREFIPQDIEVYS